MSLRHRRHTSPALKSPESKTLHSLGEGYPLTKTLLNLRPPGGSRSSQRWGSPRSIIRCWNVRGRVTEKVAQNSEQFQLAYILLLITLRNFRQCDFMDNISVISIGRVTEIGHLSCLPVQRNRQAASSNRGTLLSRGRIVCPGHFKAVVFMNKLILGRRK